MEKSDDRNSEARAGQSGKRTYEPPEILSQKVFETTALACMKVSCLGSPKS
jgi:hypothetical protein